ncbi:MAG: TonB-dependent receptor [Bacteroidota bacterium]
MGKTNPNRARQLRIFVVLCFGAITAMAQESVLDKRISITIKDKSLMQALSLLEKEANCSFSYSPDALDERQTVSGTFLNTPLRKVLNTLIQDYRPNYLVLGNTVLIKTKRPGTQSKDPPLPEKGVKGTIKGIITDDSNNPLPFASVLLKNTGYGASSDENGTFLFTAPAGNYTLATKTIGYEDTEKNVTISPNKTTIVSLRVAEQREELNEVVVRGKSESKRIEEQPLQITSINVTPLQSETADVVKILDRTTGVRIRQSGGLGSFTTIQLNGFSGSAVRVYYDGIPLQLYGVSLQLNNIPATNIDRIDVYKGAMPIDVGTDALAGGINVVSKQIDRDYLDVSYQAASFNTHIGTFNVGKTFGDRFFLALSGFYNYSDNDYETKAVQRLPNFTEVDVTVDRFHSAHESYLAQGSLGLKNTLWADELKYSFGINGRNDELQHGVRLPTVPAGDATLESDSYVHNLSYRKEFKDKLVTHYTGSYLVTNETVNDSTLNQYDWFGNVVGMRVADASEILGRPSLREGKSRSHVHRLNLTYDLHADQTVKLSSFYTNQRTRGNDVVQLAERGFDPNEIPSTLNRWVNGISHEGKWFGSKLETLIFGKHYYYDQNIADFRLSQNTMVSQFEQKDNAFGYGLGIKYSFRKNFYLKSSFERTLRLPDANEVFGDFITIEPNFLLLPERSNNINLGGFYQYNLNDYQYIALDLNLFARQQTDLIRLEPGRSVNDPAQFINEDEVDGYGLEFSFRIAPIRNVELTSNLTLQRLEKGGEPNVGNTNGVGFPIPNIPQTFFNLQGRYRFTGPWLKSDEFSVFGYYNFVDEFDLIFQPTRNEDNIIPAQRQLDLGMGYDWKKAHLSFSFQANNILNTEVFDNFRVPKPGRNYAFKIRYNVQKL